MALKCLKCCIFGASKEENDDNDYYGLTENSTTLLMSDGETSAQYSDGKEKMVVALYSYKDATCLEGDLPFEKNERMQVLEEIENGTWLRVRSISNSQEGYVPSNYVDLLYDDSWYFKDVSSRLESEILLGNNNNPVGAFLVRKTKSTKQSHTHTLSYKKNSSFSHIRIYSDNDEFYFNNEHKFVTLNQLITYCIDDSEDIAIKKPCIRAPVADLSFLNDFEEKWILDRNDIQLGPVIGQGKTGVVYKGTWNNITVAVKSIINAIDEEEFKKEASLLRKMSHKNIVTMIGICMKDEMLLVQEFMPKGSVLSVITNERNNLSYKELQYIACQAACGLSYLEDHNYIHRDIAARNILLSDNLVCKIADFGMARCLVNPVYIKSTQLTLPIRWTAPEALLNNEFSVKSDVWSYGIFLMELFTYGELPYADITSHFEVFNKIQAGYRMPKPQGHVIQNEDFKIIRSCWLHDPKKRPTFQKLRNHFENEELLHS